MKHGKPNKIYLKDYKRPEFWIDNVELFFDIEEDQTQVESKINFRRNTEFKLEDPTLILDGEQLILKSLEINELEVSKEDCIVDDKTLTIKNLVKYINFQESDNFVLRVINTINPAKNTSLEGLYYASDIYCTQCEAQGFRKITYFLDRPDIMAKYKTTIRGSKEKLPFMLSNGNLVSKRDLPNLRHETVWEDPFNKPCYLFALVAGDLAVVKDQFKTKSGRTVDLEFYVDHGNESKCDHAIESLKNSMKWDEDTFDLEYDLDLYMVVAVDSFNMGAMENKGLNVFNSAYVLASPETATDSDYDGVEAVIGHEYFHNWTGNRVTCRDWFQLTLKEGLTVFRDQEFSSDMNDRGVLRIDQVNTLRNHQFAEDQGPMSHPIKPTSYIEINNFYTATVYEKGSEVIRMVRTILGRENFALGIKKYFELFDGQAVTTEDFIRAMEIASGTNLNQFKNWYYQAGTPILKVRDEWDEANSSYTLKFNQDFKFVKNHMDADNHNAEVGDFVIPFKLKLIDNKNGSLKMVTSHEKWNEDGEFLLIDKLDEQITFTNLNSKPTPSMLREFSAPIILDYEYSDEQLQALISNDDDLFNRWEALQLTYKKWISSLLYEQDKLNANLNQTATAFIGPYKEIFIKLLNDKNLTGDYKSYLFTLPSISYLGDVLNFYNYPALEKARDCLLNAIAICLEEDFKKTYDHCSTNEENDPRKAKYNRSLKNLCLRYLCQLEKESYLELAYNQRKNAKNMTDELASLSCLQKTESNYKENALNEFYEKWKDEFLVVCKWLSVQSSSSSISTLNRVKALLDHPSFDFKNPNKIRSVLGAFALRNLSNFHKPDGEAYEFVSEQIIKLNSINPQIASRLVQAFNRYKKMPLINQEKIKEQLIKIKSTPSLSNDVYEIVEKILN